MCDANTNNAAENVSDNDIHLKEVGKIFTKEKGYKFFIPDYQRGYRWDRRQALDLLDDIEDFQNKNKDNNNKKEIYLLQPLVVCYDDVEKRWRVVDGQQRLTTIFILLKYLFRKKDPYKDLEFIKYQTRESSSTFLKEINLNKNTEKVARENVDYYHMYHVYKTIEDWFSDKDSSFEERFTTSVLEKLTFIWDPIDEKDENDIFERLNSGKIALSDAELIKAMFVNRNNFKDGLNKQQIIANEWYEIENKLQNDEFWYFLHSGDYSRPTRIDFILDLMCRNDHFKLIESLGQEKYDELMKDDHGIARYFSWLFNNINSENNKSKYKSVEKIWNKIKYFFDVFVEWYEDCKLYHYIGYLVAVKGKDSENFLCECVKLWHGDKAKFAYKNNIICKMQDEKSFVAELENEILFHLKTGFIGDLMDALIMKGKNTKKLKDIVGLNEYLGSIEYKTKKDNGSIYIEDYLFNMKFEESDENTADSNNNGTKDNKLRYGKRHCVNLLLLHNIETIIKYNNLLAKNKNGLPYFKRFPFHLYNNDNWEVEHIRPNSGDSVNKESERLIFLHYAKEYFGIDSASADSASADSTSADSSAADEDVYKPDELQKAIDSYISSTKDISLDYNKLENDNGAEAGELKERTDEFNKICRSLDIALGGKELAENEKNRIWNYTLLDKSTNCEYGNHVFPFKRDYIVQKERGVKLKKYIYKDNEKYIVKDVREKKNELVKMIMAYETSDEENQRCIRNYVNKIKIDSLGDSVVSPSAISESVQKAEGAWEEAKKAANIKKGDTFDDNNKYQLQKIKGAKNDQLKYKYVEAPEEAPFFLDVTRNIFTKYYSQTVSTMLHWTEDDARAYWNDIKRVLNQYFVELNDEVKNRGGKKNGQ